MEKVILKMLELLKDVPKKWIVFLGFVAIVGSSTGMPYFVDFLKWSVSSFQEPKMGRALTLTTDMFRLMNKIRVALEADKVLILKAHDSGRPRPGTRMQSSIVHEVWANGSEEYYDDWQGQVIDEDYIMMLQKIYDNGTIDLVTKSMNPGLLKTGFVATEVQQARIVKLYVTDTEIFYLSIVWRRDVRPLTPAEEGVVRSGATSLSRIITQGERL